MKMNPLILWVLLCLGAHDIGAQPCNEGIPSTAPDSRFTVAGEEVTDTRAGLVWQRCSLGQVGSGCDGTAARYTWSEALQVAEKERLVTNLPWRVPNAKELESLVEERCFRPAINRTMFPRTRTSDYWSSSPYAGYSAAWRVNFYYGYASPYEKSNTFYVRLVRDAK